jgi:hypothetical protein
MAGYQSVRGLVGMVQALPLDRDRVDPTLDAAAAVAGRDAACQPATPSRWVGWWWRG